MRLGSWIVTTQLSTLVLAFAAYSQTESLQQHLQNQYQDKTFLLRDFYSNKRLQYDAAGAPIGTPTRGSWTIDGFVLVTETRVQDQALVIKGRRMAVISTGRGFQFQADSPKNKKEVSKFEIEARIGAGESVEHLDALMDKIFLNARDSLVAAAPSYWRACMSAGLREVNDSTFAGCRFSSELLTIPGVNPNADARATSDKNQTALPSSNTLHVLRVGKGISPPGPLYTPQPQFSGLAKETKFQGVVILGLIVDDHGEPRAIQILSPLGAGLDEEAVRTVRTWKFKPAQREDHTPVAVEIAVEVNFHLY